MIAQTQCTSFKAEILAAVHDFTATTGDVFKLALYASTASLGADTTVYTSTDEVVATGYTAGGVTLTSLGVGTETGTAYVSFDDVSIAAALSADGALIYNSSEANKAVAVLNFGSTKTSTTNFQIAFPANAGDSAVIRIE